MCLRRLIDGRGDDYCARPLVGRLMLHTEAQNQLNDGNDAAPGIFCQLGINSGQG